ncbi:MAG: response regulator transcription factor [Clostridium sp.]
MSIKVAIVDDDALIRESLKIILGVQQDIEIIGTFQNGQDFLRFNGENEVDIVLMDIRMPVLNGVDTTEEINRRGYSTRVIILTTFDEMDYISKALSNGAKGYILKNTTPDQIIDTIKMVYNGISAIQEDVLMKYNNLASTKDERGKIDESLFTERELDVIKEIANGLSNKEISQKLFISEGTVKNYITSILNKLGLKHRTQIAVYYLKGI